MLLLNQACPWKDHLFDIEEENKKEELIKFVFFKDDRGLFRIQTVAPKHDHFGQRVPICKAWRGLRTDELKKASEFKDMEFVHASGFIGGAWSLETCIKMAELSITEKA